MGRQKQEFHHLRRLSLKEIRASGAPKSVAEDPSLEGLASSLVGRGQQEPILVTEAARRGGYRIVMGWRRYLAAKQLGWEELDCLVLGREYQAEVEVIERLQQGTFDPFELADTLQRLKDSLGWTQAHLGIAVGKTRDFVANILAISNIAPEVRRHIQGSARGHSLTARHLRYVARMRPEDQLAAAKHIISNRLSTKRLEQERSQAARHSDHEFIRVRPLRKAGTPQSPRNAVEWRRYARQLTTDLGRIERREVHETKRAQARVEMLRERERLVRAEARRKRRELGQELRQARRALARAQDR
jgi:ParB/RepB/Spo0J family partition protein